MLLVAVAQRHRVDHHQALVFELDRHHLQRNPIGVIAAEDDPGIGSGPSSGRGVLLEAQATMFDDVARAFTGDPVLGRGREPIAGSRGRSNYYVGQY